MKALFHGVLSSCLLSGVFETEEVVHGVRCFTDNQLMWRRSLMFWCWLIQTTQWVLLLAKHPIFVWSVEGGNTAERTTERYTHCYPFFSRGWVGLERPSQDSHLCREENTGHGTVGGGGGEKGCLVTRKGLWSAVCIPEFGCGHASHSDAHSEMPLRLCYLGGPFPPIVKMLQ